jgi:hypothetical protein
VSIDTADPAATIKSACAALNGKAGSVPVCTWNLLDGLRGISKPGQDYAAQVAPDGPIQSANPAECLALLAKTPPEKGIVFLSNAHRIIDDASVAQGIWNLRDIFKGIGATLVLLSPSLRLPAELARDVVSITEPLPTAEEHGKTVDDTLSGTTPPLAPPTGQERAAVLDTLLGLSSFEAEQAIALSLRKDGIDRADLWSRKVRAVEQTDGLSVYRGKERYADTAGLANAKATIGSTVRGKMRISCLVFLDELDKAMAASGTDTSGTTQDQNKVLLSYLQDNDVPGTLWLGPPGTGKTMLAKATAGEYAIPLIMLDLGAMKGSLVGQSEQRMRQAIKVIHAISDGRALFIGACNRTENLPPELRRRFNYLSLFFDLPDAEERAATLKVWTAKYDLDAALLDWTPPAGWTGAEIRNACLKAWAMGVPLSQAAQTIVPIARSAADTVEALRKSASGKYISASAPGLYNYDATHTPTAQGRKLEV